MLFHQLKDLFWLCWWNLEERSDPILSGIELIVPWFPSVKRLVWEKHIFQEWKRLQEWKTTHILNKQCEVYLFIYFVLLMLKIVLPCQFSKVLILGLGIVVMEAPLKRMRPLFGQMSEGSQVSIVTISVEILKWQWLTYQG